MGDLIQEGLWDIHQLSFLAFKNHATAVLNSFLTSELGSGFDSVIGMASQK